MGKIRNLLGLAFLKAAFTVDLPKPHTEVGDDYLMWLCFANAGNCDAFLENGGFLLFDDSTIEAFGVRNLMPELTASGRYKLVAANPNHLFQKAK